MSTSHWHVKRFYSHDYQLTDAFLYIVSISFNSTFQFLKREGQFHDNVDGVNVGLLMNSFNKTEAAIFSCRLCFLRAFPFISLNHVMSSDSCSVSVSRFTNTCFHRTSSPGCYGYCTTPLCLWIRPSFWKIQ